MSKNQAISSTVERDYQCQSVHKNDSDQNIRIRYVQIWGRYISQQEESKKL